MTRHRLPRLPVPWRDTDALYRDEPRILLVLQKTHGTVWRGRSLTGLLRLHQAIITRQMPMWQALSSNASSEGERSRAITLAFRLATLGHQLRHDAGLSATEALAWLTVSAGGPDAWAATSLERLIDDRPVDARPGEQVWRLRLNSLREPVTIMDRWRAAAPRGLAPLAWAAGLSPDEARARWCDGTLYEAELRTLAALRGYQLLDVRSGHPTGSDSSGSEDRP